MLFQHEVAVEPYQGPGAYGPVYGASATVRCLKTAGGRLVRDPATGDQVASVATLYCPAGTSVPVQSRVTVDGETRTAAEVKLYDGGALPLPGSVVVSLT